MFESISENTQHQIFGACNRLVAAGPVGEHAGKVDDFGDPATVVLALNLDDEIAHVRIVYTATFYARRSMPSTLTSSSISGQ